MPCCNIAALLAVLMPQTEGRSPIVRGLSPCYQHVFNRNAVSDSRAFIVVVTTRDVHDLGAGRRWELDLRANRLTIHMDRAARPWIGSDNGEWGGWVARVNLLTGKLEVHPGCLTESEDRSREFAAGQFRCHGVHLFTELRNGTMWVHGGTTHLGLSSVWIARLDEAGILGLFGNEHSSRASEKKIRQINLLSRC